MIVSQRLFSIKYTIANRKKNNNFQQMLYLSVNEGIAAMRLVLQQTKGAAAAAAAASLSNGGDSDGSRLGAQKNTKSMVSHELRSIDCMRFFT